MKEMVKEMNKFNLVDAEIRNGKIYMTIWDDEVNQKEYWEVEEEINHLIKKARQAGMEVNIYWTSEDE